MIVDTGWGGTSCHVLIQFCSNEVMHEEEIRKKCLRIHHVDQSIGSVSSLFSHDLVDDAAGLHDTFEQVRSWHGDLSDIGSFTFISEALCTRDESH